MSDLLLYNAVNQGVFSKGEENPPHLGLFALSAYVKEKGYSVKLVNNIRFLDVDKDLKPLLKEALLVGVSCMTGDPIRNGIEFSKAVKKLAPDMPIVWGGYHASLEPDQVISNGYIDFVIRGWGEEPIVELLDALKYKTDFMDIKGLSFRRGKESVHNPARDCDDINKFPMYDYDLQESFGAMIKGRDFIYCSSRGCPFKCTFCSISAFYAGNKPYYCYNLDRVFGEVEYLQKRYEPDSFFFWDDNFFMNKSRVIDFCRIYKARKCTFKWCAFGRCDFFANCDSELLALLKSVNLTRIYFGAESGSDKILKKIKKNITVQQIVKSLESIKRYNIGGDYTFMSGFPFETLDDLRCTLAVMKKLQKIEGTVGMRIFNFTPSPKIEIIKDCMEKGFEYPKAMEDWAKYEYHSFIPSWVGPGHHRLLRVLPWLTTFLSNETRPSKKGAANLAIRLLSASAKFRFNNNFYFFPVEWLAVRYFYKRHLRI